MVIAGLMNHCRFKIQRHLLGCFDGFTLGSLIALLAALLPSTGVNFLTIRLMM